VHRLFTLVVHFGMLSFSARANSIGITTSTSLRMSLVEYLEKDLEHGTKPRDQGENLVGDSSRNKAALLATRRRPETSRIKGKPMPLQVTMQKSVKITLRSTTPFRLVGD
jgi:hypothetical protein